MGELIMPDGGRIEMPTPPTAVEQQMLQFLYEIMRLLDIQVRLECGSLKRATLKADLLAAEAAMREAYEEQRKAADPEGDAKADIEAAAAELDAQRGVVDLST